MPSDEKLVEVTQADRDAAAEHYHQYIASKIVDGKLDDNPLVQAFARHRIEALSTPAGDAVSLDHARLALWQAIEAIKISNKTDDKLILENLRKAGFWICTLEQKGDVSCTTIAAHTNSCKGDGAAAPDPIPAGEAVALTECANCKGMFGDLAPGRQPEELCDTCYQDALTAAPATQDAGVLRAEDRAFLSDLAARIFRNAAPAQGFDQGDVDRLYRLAALSPATPTEDAPEL